MEKKSIKQVYFNALSTILDARNGSIRMFYNFEDFMDRKMNIYEKDYWERKINRQDEVIKFIINRLNKIL